MVTRLTAVQALFVQECRVGRLATVDARGEAFIVPICYAFDGERFYTPIDEKPKRRDRPLKRVRNIQESGRATLVIDHYDDEDWNQLAWVMVRGCAGLIDYDHELHARAVDLLRTRYQQYRSMNLDVAQIIVLEPDRVTAWGLMDDGHQ